MMQEFLAFSAEVTHFSVLELFGRGTATDYLDAVKRAIGDDLLRELLDAWSGLKCLAANDRRDRLRHDIFGNEKLGPIARNIMRIWYNGGIWKELPRAWTEAYGALGNNYAFMVSDESYPEGLMWLAIGANPPGAKAPGYGSWHYPPNIPPIL